MNPGLHDALDAFGPQAAHVAQLWNVFLFICGAVFLVVMATLAYALWRAPRIRAQEAPDLSTVNRIEPGPRRHVTIAITATIVLLLVLLGASVFTDRALARLPLKDALNIEVTGNQWWWSVTYMEGPVSDTFVTANEIHVPVGRPVLVRLRASDVIHSFWVPSLTGKRDLIPGRTATIAFRADQPGIYRGQCAEFCGFQHAFMAFEVHAQSPADFEAWRQAQLAVPPAPTDPQALRGQALFQSIQCAMCHAVQGTVAQSHNAPDLTHVASRRTIGAGTLPNTPANLASWITDPHRHKPGVNMPANPMSKEDLDALVAYLGTLK